MTLGLWSGQRLEAEATGGGARLTGGVEAEGVNHAGCRDDERVGGAARDAEDLGGDRMHLRDRFCLAASVLLPACPIAAHPTKSAAAVRRRRGRQSSELP